MIRVLSVALLTVAVVGRLEAATYVVNYFDDFVDNNIGDGICDTQPEPGAQCSLRAAVAEADAFDDPDVVEIPAPPPGQEISMDLLSSLGGGALVLSKNTRLVGVGPGPVVIFGGGESFVPVIQFVATSQVPVVENLTIECSSASFFFVGIEGSGNGTLKDVFVRECGRGFYGTTSGDVVLERVVLEENVHGIYSEGGTTHVLDSWIHSNDAGTGNGGGIFATNSLGSDEVFTLENSLVENNQGGRGGGLALEFLVQVAVVNSTISGNRATVDGGGVHADLGAVLGLFSSTLALNAADSDLDDNGLGGGIWGSGDSVFVMRNTIMSDNTAEASSPDSADCHLTGLITSSSGHNLIHRFTACGAVAGETTNVLGQSAELGPLGDNLGPTDTHLPATDSPAVDAGNPAGCGFDHDLNSLTADLLLTSDQRGLDRVVDGDGDLNAICDIGAVELGLTVIFADGFESGAPDQWD